MGSHAPRDPAPPPALAPPFALAALVAALAAPLGALAAPPPSPAAFECDRLVAAAAFTDAERPCAAAETPGNLQALTRARAGDLADRTGPNGLTATTTALADAARARNAAPDRVIEEALFQHLARVVRALTPPQTRPDLAQWPLAGLPVPAPTLPRIEDERLDALNAAMGRSDERIREVEARLAGVDPRFGALPPAARQSLAQALTALRGERARLVDKRLEILKERAGKKAPTDLLHLADTYFAIDAALPTPIGQRKRGIAELRRIRDRHATDGAAGIAALWLAGFYLDEGQPDRARPLLDEAGPFDPALSTFFDALLDWRRGEARAALESLATIRGPLSPALTAQVEALKALIASETDDPLTAATAWLRAAENAPAEQARRARLNAAIAWSAALATAQDPPATARQIPTDLRAATYLHTLTRGRLADTRTLFDAIEATGRPAELPHLGLMLVDAARATGDAATADLLLAHLVATCAQDGLWRTTHAGETADTARNRLLARVERRINQLIEANIPLPPAARAPIAPLATVRLERFELDDPARLTLAAALGQLGFLEQAEPHLTRLATEATDPLLRRDAAAAHLRALVQRARELGAAGTPTGPWLLGPRPTGPRPEIITRITEAQTRLIGQLPLNSPTRDERIVDRATIRLDFGEIEGIAAELQPIITRHPTTTLALRALDQLMRARPADASRLAAESTARGIGPPARNRMLQTLWQTTWPDPARDPARADMQAGRYPQAAARYEAAASAPGADPAPARLAAALAWTWALRPTEADAAWKTFLDQHPTHPAAPTAHYLRARLLETQGRPADAAAAHRAAAARAAATRASDARPATLDAPRALLRALRLTAGDHPTTQATLTQFTTTFPTHDQTPRLTTALAALQGTHPLTDRPPGPPPQPPLPATPCQAKACLDARFWPETR